MVFGERLADDAISAYAFSARRTREAPSHYRIIKCLGCGLVRSDGIIPELSANSLYRESRYLYQEESAFAAETYFRLFREVVEMARPGFKVMDVGCGNGSFLKRLYEDVSCDVTGIEPSRESLANADPAIQKRIVQDVFKADSYDADSFDAVCAFHLIDHLYSPGEFFDGVLRILRPGGIFLCVCHDVEAWSARLFGEDSGIFDVEHVYLFDKKTLPALLTKRGFKVERIGSLKNTYPLSYWLRIAPYCNLLRRCLPRYIVALPLAIRAGNIFALAKKPG